MKTIVFLCGLIGAMIVLGAVKLPAQQCGGTAQMRVECGATGATEDEARAKVQDCIMTQILQATTNNPCRGECVKVTEQCRPFPGAKIPPNQIQCVRTPQGQYSCRYIGAVTVQCKCAPGKCGKVFYLPFGASFSANICDQGTAGDTNRLINRARQAVLLSLHQYLTSMCTGLQCAEYQQEGQCSSGVKKNTVDDSFVWQYVLRGIVPLPAVSPVKQVGNSRCVTATISLSSFRCFCGP